mmetsp:Transcript_8591/g.27345  ORF Transcript_8591/g.27345 Transcript_8591/m.27345 type:complete len:205 (+) Transcript_8591:200-814(+)
MMMSRRMMSSGRHRRRPRWRRLSPGARRASPTSPSPSPKGLSRLGACHQRRVARTTGTQMVSGVGTTCRAVGNAMITAAGSERMEREAIRGKGSSIRRAGGAAGWRGRPREGPAGGTSPHGTSRGARGKGLSRPLLLRRTCLASRAHRGLQRRCSPCAPSCTASSPRAAASTMSSASQSPTGVMNSGPLRRTPPRRCASVSTTA